MPGGLLIWSRVPNGPDRLYTWRVKAGVVSYTQLPTPELDASAMDLSPDHRTLLIANHGAGDLEGILVYDLGRTRVTATVPVSTRCVTWSTDGKRFSYVDGDNKLWVHAMVGGKDRYVASAPTALYTVVGKVVSYIECGTWTGAAQLVFKRYVGELPGSIDSSTYSPDIFGANTVTTARIGSTISLTNRKPGRDDWFVWAVSASLRYAILERATGATREYYLADGQRVLSNPGASLRSVGARALPCATRAKACGPLGFVGETDTVLALQTASRAGAADGLVYQVNPATLSVQQRGNPGRTDWYLPNGPSLWAGGPDEQFAAVPARDPDPTVQYGTVVMLVGARTLKTTPISKDSNITILAWLADG